MLNEPFIGVVIFTDGVSDVHSEQRKTTVLRGLKPRYPSEHPPKPIYYPSSGSTPLQAIFSPSGEPAEKTETGTPRKRPAYLCETFAMESNNAGVKQTEVIALYYGPKPPKIRKISPGTCAKIDPILPPSSSAHKTGSLLIPPGKIQQSREEISCLPPRPISQSGIMGCSASAVVGETSSPEKGEVHLEHTIGRAMRRRTLDVTREPDIGTEDLCVGSSGHNLSTDTRIEHLAEHLSAWSKDNPILFSAKASLQPHPVIPGAYLHVAHEKTTKMQFLPRPGAPEIRKKLTFVAKTFGKQPTKHTHGFFKQVAKDMDPAKPNLTNDENVSPNVVLIK
jgi:hypothetical protein